MNELSPSIARKQRLNLVGDMSNSTAPRGFGGKHNKAKDKKWSHQDELATLRGRQVQIEVRGDTLVGELVEADQFALKFRANGQQSTVTYFKHAIDNYRAV